MKYLSMSIVVLVIVVGMVVSRGLGSRSLSPQELENIGSPAYRQTRLIFSGIYTPKIAQDDSGSRYGQFFAIGFSPAMDPFDYLMKGKPYIPDPVNYLDTAVSIELWALPKPYQQLTIHSLLMELEDGRQLELLDAGDLVYTFPTMTQIKNKPYGKKEYFWKAGRSDEDYTFDESYYDQPWTSTVAIFPRIRQEIVGLELAEVPEDFVKTSLQLTIVYSFDAEAERHRETFSFEAAYGRALGHLPPKPAYKPANDYMNELEKNRP